MTTINFGTTFIERNRANIVRGNANAPDYLFDQPQLLDNLCVEISAISPNTKFKRACAYVCPCLRVTNPASVIFLQQFAMTMFPLQKLVFNRSSLSLAGLDPSGGANRRDLVPAVWLLEPFTAATVIFYTF